MSDDALQMWTVYDHPKDCPEHFVVRRFEIRAGAATATDEAYISKHLDLIREALMKLGLHRLPRQPNDEPHIMETWL